MDIRPRIPVLLVDDRPENLTSLEVILNDMGLDLVSAQSGNEALRLSLHTDFAVVLMDVQMPEMNGFETAELMRENPKTREFPIIFVTAGMKEKYHVFRGYEAGAVDYLTKPIEAAVLRSKVRVFCELFNTRLKLKLKEESLEALVAKRTADLSKTAEELLQSKKHFQNLLESIISYVYTVTIENGQQVKKVHNAACESVSGFSLEEFESDRDLWYNITVPEDRMALLDATKRLMSEKKTVTLEHRISRSDGNQRWVATTMVPRQTIDGCLVSYDGIVVDITDRKRLEDQLVQAQKLESVGRLAGGVAHDFNNMLSVILGHVSLASENPCLSSSLQASLNEIRKAAERSTDLTRQLLAFARKQTIAPKVLDLNDTVSGMLKMLQRLIGEDILLIWKPTTHLWPIKMDTSQIDQILANLCVNARDAISDIGRITIETGNCSINDDFSVRNAGFVTGEYVCLAVSDDGCGMDKNTQAQIFEPFFTTKEIGKGTGLGLATLYGIIKQNGGFINVKSEPGTGTAFSIYIPRHTTGETPAQVKSAKESPQRGGETILLVEDEQAILNISTLLLRNQGYKVLAAKSPIEAMTLASKHANEIHLLLTDVIMPGMNGRDLANNLLAFCPKLKCLFMSGYTADIIAHHGVLDSGMHFIEKPFNLPNLANKVREVLDQ
ncbi:MAG: response regulator [Oryzomonas sp.]|uniref:response regulator n=1 Tax=Oryzomonas sp. TaxID=2855186 RepID=UPI00284FD751|nr:response regulator [Oryzomonas sp.]MDR3580479.1 response regulator [Oryzomonas sp.]